MFRRLTEWYADGPGQQAHELELELTLSEETPGHFVYDSTAFFPLDGMGFGNQFRDHNFSFTTEIHTRFDYRGRRVSSRSGRRRCLGVHQRHLAIDLGGVHARDREYRVRRRGLPARYQDRQNDTLDIFHAERHTGVELSHRDDDHLLPPCRRGRPCQGRR